MLNFFLFFLSCFIFELIYIQVAQKLKIYDHPNERGSHNSKTIRGGGIIFILPIFTYFVLIQPSFSYLILIGILIIFFTSFYDDLFNIVPEKKVFLYLLAVLFFLIHYGQGHYEGWVIFGLLTSFLFLNYFNFMDGINGMTGLYSMSFILPMLYYFQNGLSDLFILILISILVFGFFNFRTKPIVFAGDVGSMFLGMMFLYIFLEHLHTYNDIYILLAFLLYFVDCSFTILERLFKGDNILKPHRKHLYQILANEHKINHILISSIYAVVQLTITIIVFKYGFDAFLIFVLTLSVSLVYCLLKYYYLPKKVKSINLS